MGRAARIVCDGLAAPLRVQTFLVSGPAAQSAPGSAGSPPSAYPGCACNVLGLSGCAKT
jgi:hypothetical protein